MANNIIVPEIFANVLNEKMDVSLRVAKLAYNATSEVSEIQQAGSTVVFPQISLLSEAEEVIKGTPITPEEIDMYDTRSVVKHISKSARVYDKDVIQTVGNLVDRVTEQVAQSMAKRLDSELISAMDTDAVYKTPTMAADSITYAELQDAIGLFGDDIDSQTYSGLVVNSRIASSLMTMPEFIGTNYTFQNGNNNGIVKDGVIGYLFGSIPVVVSNHNTYNTVSKSCRSYLLKKNSLAYIWQKNITVEVEREAKLFANSIISSALYATKLLNPKGLVIIGKDV